MSHPIEETQVNIVSEQTHLEGELFFESVTRVHGTLKGQINGQKGSTLILTESSVVEGKVNADTLIIEGFVKGDIVAETKIIIAPQGRVLGTLTTPSLSIAPGAFFEGSASMQKFTQNQ